MSPDATAPKYGATRPSPTRIGGDLDYLGRQFRELLARDQAWRDLLIAMMLFALQDDSDAT